MTARNPSHMSGAWLQRIKDHWAIIPVLCLAIFPLFADLGGDFLWEDEGDTAVLALNVVKYGVPRAWDGKTFIDSDQGQRENSDLVMVSHPWVQYYLAAGSFLVFGETPFAARFPFALAGWFTILAAYALTFRLTSAKKAALAAAILLAVSIQFALLCRQCRNYPVAMLMTCVLLFAFLRLRDWKTSLHFALAGILLFHTHPAAVAPLAALGLLTLVHKSFRIYRKWFWTAAPFIGLLTVPWLFLAKGGYQENSSAIPSLAILPARLTQFFIECASATPAVGIIILFILIWVRHYRGARAEKDPRKKLSIKEGQQLSYSLFRENERILIILICSIFLMYGLLVTLTQSRAEMWQMGIRHVAAIVPLAAVFLGMLIARFSHGSMKTWTILILVFCLTKLGGLAPWTFLVQEEKMLLGSSDVVALHTPRGWANKIFRLGLISFYRDLWNENPGTVSRIAQFLQSNAAPEDILITNYAWEPLYFHTRLRQGLKILPEQPIYQIARSHGLPDYVFTIADADWVVWRRAWDGYQGYEWTLLIQAMQESGATLERVATLPETIWENRENIHFRRFPDEDYKYGWMANPAPTEIYRVHWTTQTPITTGSNAVN